MILARRSIPEGGTCDLYAARPLTCRTFGPAISWNSDAVGVCELCFVGAGDEEICRLFGGAGRWRACEAVLLGQMGADHPTTVALALV